MAKQPLGRCRRPSHSGHWSYRTGLYGVSLLSYSTRVSTSTSSVPTPYLDAGPSTGPSHTELTSLLSRASEWFVSWETVRAAHGIAFARPEWRLALSQSHTPLRSHVLQDRRLNFVFPSLREKPTRRHSTARLLAKLS